MALRERVLCSDRLAGTAALPASARALADPHALPRLGRADLELPTLLIEPGRRCASFPLAWSRVEPKSKRFSGQAP